VTDITKTHNTNKYTDILYMRIFKI